MSGFELSTPALRMRYVPANSRKDLPPDSKHLPMDAFLVSPRVQRVSLAAAEDIADVARRSAEAQGIFRTGVYLSSFRVSIRPPIVADGNPRAAARVENIAPHAMIVEAGSYHFGRGRWILKRAGAQFHTPAIAERESR